MRPQLTVLEGGLMRKHRREQGLFERCRRLGIAVEKMDVPAGSRSQYLIVASDGVEMQFGLGTLERVIKGIEDGKWSG